MIEWIVFSRNRAYQLYALLKTAREYGLVLSQSIAVLTRYDVEHQASLDVVRAVFPGCRWIERTDFERDLMAALDCAGRTVAFATDDSLFTRRVQWRVGEWALTAGASGYSHRLGLHLRACYPTRSGQELPADLEDAGHWLKWRWRSAAGDWRMMGSIDATQYRTDDVRRWAVGATSPNDLEDRLAASVEREIGACGPLACYVTNPANVVQTTHRNRHAGGSADELLTRFMLGQRPATAGVARLVNVSCHQEIEI